MRMKFTTAGRTALVNAAHTGTQATLVTHIGVTETAFTADPDGGDVVLPGERKRLTTFSGKAVANDVIHVTVRDDGDDVYSLRGIALYLEDGTLLCLYGQQDLILEKSAKAVMLLAADLMLADIDAHQITFGSTDFLNPPATVEVQGVVELATDEEAVQGADRNRAITPAALRAALDERIGLNAPTGLAKQVLAAATEVAMRALLELKSAALRNEGTGNGLDADLLDGQEGAYYLAYENLTGRPRSFLLPGQIVVMATSQAPTGTLLCDGTEVSRAQYQHLFAAIGTTFGDGDGASTFNLPRFASGQTVLHSEQPAEVGTISNGAVIGHTHGATVAAVGDHVHHIGIIAAGEHAHGAGCHGAGDHIHAAWTDAQGHHGHTGGTSHGGDHTHTIWQGNAPSNGQGGGPGFDNPTFNGTSSAAGGHSHPFSTDGAGNHAHNIGMNGVGHHAHQIDVGAGGHHAHSVDHWGAGTHTHGIDIAASGGAANLAAGIHMIYCIAY